MKKGILIICCFCMVLNALAQADTLIIENPKDTVELKSYATRYDPRKAILFAAVLPGLGQVYNKKYWKLPLVYGGLAATGYAINFYNTGYKKYKSQLFYNLETNPGNENAQHPVSRFTTSQLRTITNKYRRERDFMVIIMAGVYILQMVDAHVDAHLKEFDLNPNLHVRIEPTWENDMMMGQTKGVALKFRF
jgi:hypothetical protein